MAWLHDDAGYSYLGDQRYGKLTPNELLVLQLGFMVMNERQQEDGDGSRGSRMTEADRQEYIDEYQQRNNLGPYEGPTASA